MHRFSIIVPIIGDERPFDDTLASVLRYRPESSQVIVVHDGTYDDPYHLQDEIKFVSTDRGSQLPDLLRSALLESTGELVAVIRPGIELTQDWNLPVESSFDDDRIGSVSPIMVTPARPNRIVSAGINCGFGLRRIHVGTGKRIAPRNLKKIKPLGPSLWAAFYRRSALEKIGDLTSHQLDSIFLDLDIALSLQMLGYENEVCSDCVVMAERSLPVTRESSQPHGRSAQRAYRRHPAATGQGSSLGKSIGVFLAELLSTPLSPWRFQHAIQRLGAWSHIGADREFAEQLAEIAQAKWLQDELGGYSAGLATDSQTDQVVERRAA